MSKFEIQPVAIMTDYSTYLTINPEIRFGKPTIKGTRIAVSDVLEWLASGVTHQEIIEDYSLTEEQILAALSFDPPSKGSTPESYVE